MSFCEFSHTHEENLPIPSKVGIKKQNYDVTKKFQDKWVMKLPWAQLFTKEDGN
jgi:hypothetical protein